jgi:superfamily II DNA or RNA helicase
MILRPYQADGIESACEHLDRHNSTLGVYATGLGKTLIFSQIAKQFLNKGRVMVIADREELLTQSRDTIQTTTGIRPDLEMADSHACTGMYKSPVVVSSIQTQRSGNGVKRWERFDPNEFSLLIIDEADLGVADSYLEMLKHYRQNPRLKVYGTTATADRHDKKSLGQIFESVCFNYGIVDAINEGWLVPIKQKYLNVEVDFSGVTYRLGDFDKGELRDLLAQGSTLEQIASDSIQYAGERRTLVFSDSVANAERLTEVFNRHTIGSARIVTGETPKDERRKLFAEYRGGYFQYLVNVGVAGRGLDVPQVSCIVQARPTCSRPVYQQQIGRATRPVCDEINHLQLAADRKAAIAASPKPNALICDLVGNSTKHKLITAADILGGKFSDEVIAKADAAMQESNGGCDVMEALEEAQRLHNAEIEAEAKRKGGLSLKKKSSAKDVDPFGIYPLQRPEIDNGSPMSDAQREKIDRWKIKASKNLTEAQADEIIGEVRSRARRGLLTLNQEVTLKRYRVDTKNMSYERAHTLMDQLAKNGWRYVG